jgi:thioredoxin-like negative regulator of GroEL
MTLQETLFSEAFSALNSQNFGKAEELFRTILQSQPTNVAALNLLTVVLMSAGRFAEAKPLSPSGAAQYDLRCLLLRPDREAAEEVAAGAAAV